MIIAAEVTFCLFELEKGVADRVESQVLLGFCRWLCGLLCVLFWFSRRLRLGKTTLGGVEWTGGAAEWSGAEW